jgi:hypothetical protein
MVRGYEWVASLNGLRRNYDALACGAEQVLASNQDWIVYLRDAGHAAEDSCGSSKERVMVAIHREGKSAASGVETVGVKMAQTWMEGCRIGAAEVHTGGSSGVVSGDLLQLKADGEAVWIAACQ